MAKHPRLNDLVWFTIPCAHAADGVLDCNLGDWGVRQQYKEVCRLIC
jgi:hypothetical protein